MKKEQVILTRGKTTTSKIVFLLLLFFIFQMNTSGYSQQPKATTKPSMVAKGTVIDEYGPLIGVSIGIKGTNLGTVTDVSGNFELLIPSSVTRPVLVFSYIGKKKKEVSFNGAPINISLEDDAVLTEVVVTGIFNRAKESYTGAATRLNKSEIETAGSRSVLSSIRNLDPSFNLLENNLLGSDPNNIENMSITMRGATSLTDIQSDAQTAIRANLPLFIIDMFEAPLKSVIDLDENRIESITVLKDASATALYGSKGSNGVIVITTKKPEAGKLRITYKGKVSFEAPDLSSYN
jgi:TonB-dependent SusC/RagA subfamily outer membrane receptor